MFEVKLLACESKMAKLSKSHLSLKISTHPESKNAYSPLLLMSISLIQSDIVLNIVKYRSSLFKASNWVNLATLKNLSKKDVSAKIIPHRCEQIF